MATRLTAGLCLAMSTLCVAACGGSSTSDAQQVATTVNRLETAALNRDAATYCSLLTDAQRARLMQFLAQNVGLAGSCERVLPSVMREVATPGATHATASAVTLNGDTATVRLPDGKRVQLTKQGGTWKVSSLPGFGG